MAFPEVGGDRNVALWAFRVEKAIEEDPHVEVLNPSVDIGHRQRAQRGLFTRLEHGSSFDLAGYLETLTFNRPPFTQFLVPGSETAKAITELRMMNITFATLFPDLEGAALQRNSRRFRTR